MITLARVFSQLSILINSKVKVQLEVMAIFIAKPTQNAYLNTMPNA